MKPFLQETILGGTIGHFYFAKNRTFLFCVDTITLSVLTIHLRILQIILSYSGWGCPLEGMSSVLSVNLYFGTLGLLCALES